MSNYASYNTGKYALALLVFATLLGTSFAGGLGTSSISMASSSGAVGQGSSTTVSYTVNLASGNTWGTTLSVVNASALKSDGISVSLSNTYADPPYSGTMSISTSSSAKAGIYYITLAATGDDPSSSPANFVLNVTSFTAPRTTAPSTSTVPVTPEMKLYSSNTITFNSVNGTRNVSVVAPDGVTILATIANGTYAQINSTMSKSFNFTLATFTLTQGITSPPNESNEIPAYAYAFEVNGKISPSISFVNSSGKPMPVITNAKYPPSWGSWTFLGGTFNGTEYVGGAYAFHDTWSYNSTTGLITNTQFYKPVMWVFTITQNKTTASTTAPTTQPTTLPTTTVPVTTTPTSSPPYAIIAVVIIIIVVVAAFILMRKK